MSSNPLLAHRSRATHALSYVAPLLLGTLLGLLLFFNPPKDGSVYLGIDGGIIESLIISSLVTAATTGAEYLLASKKNLPPVDRGKLNDVRIQSSEYGAAIPKLWGKTRLAPNIIWHSPIVHTTTTTPGNGGGKGLTPKPPTPDTVTHIYTTTLALLVCEGPLANGISRMWFDYDLVFNTTALSSPFTPGGGDPLEAEAAGNTLAGGASIVSQAACSGGKKVTGLGNGGTLQFNNVSAVGTAVYELAIFYTSTSDLNLTVTVNGTPTTILCPNSGGANAVAVQTVEVALNNGSANTILFSNASAAAPDIDKIEIAPQYTPDPGDGSDKRDWTGIINPVIGYPTNPRHPWPFYNYRPPRSGTGSYTAQLAKYGQPNIRIYSGTETQLADSAIVAALGVAKAPAYRGCAVVVIENLQLQSGRVPNVTIEVDQGTTGVDQIVLDMYGLVGVPSSSMDVTALAGLTVTGWVMPNRQQLQQSIQDLQTLFQFDLPEVDGKVKAVLRSGASATTIPSSELRAHLDGQKMPDFDVLVTDLDELQLPSRVDVNYLDPALDYHNDTQSDMRLTGYSQHNQTISLPAVMTATAAKALATKLLYIPLMEGRTFKFSTGPKYLKLHPGDVVTLSLSDGTQHVVRITMQKAQMLGVIDFEGVRQAASIYSPTAAGTVSSGFSKAIAAIPGNAKGVMIDGPLLRPEDAGDGSQIVLYVAMCGRGAGTFPGGFMYQEMPIGSNVYQLLTSFAQPSHIGVATNTLATVTSTDDFDRVNTLTVDFLIPTALSSVQESDILNHPQLNLIWSGANGAGEYFQFATATPGTPAAGYASRYVLSDLLRGRFTTENRVGLHVASEDVVVMDSTIKPRRFDSGLTGQPLNYKFVSSGAALADTPVVPFTITGNSAKTPTVANVTKVLDGVNDALFYWNRRTRRGGALIGSIDVPIGEERERYQFTLPDAVPVRSWQVQTGTFIAMLLEGASRSSTIQTKWGTFVTTSGYASKNNVSGNITAFSLVSVTDTGAAVDFTIVFGSTGNASLTVLPQIFDPNNLPTPQFQFVFSFDGTINIYENGTLTTQAINFTPSRTTARFRLSFFGTEVRLYAYPMAPGQVPIYRSAIAPSFPVRVGFQTSTGTGGPSSQINSIMIGGLNYPVTIYAADQQTKDGLTPGNPIHAQIAEIGTYGPGQVTDVTL